MNIYLVGCGGTGGWLALSLAKTLHPSDTLTLIDKDKIEKHNLDRQLFSEDDIGQFKVEALASTLNTRCKVYAKPEWFTDQTELNRDSVIFSAVDNHPARVAALELADKYKSACFITGNEYTDSEAYRYHWRWQDSALDPRIYYPDLLTDHTGDPLAPCTGEEQVRHPQLAISNGLAAHYAMWLFWWWRQTYKEKAKKTDPVKINSTISGIDMMEVRHMEELYAMRGG